MADRDVVEFVEHWQIGAVILLCSLFTAFVLGWVASHAGPMFGFIGAIAGVFVGIIVYSYVYIKALSWMQRQGITA
jgi:uncharacterized membrane protein AbrB (regulator of aidB expression)